MSIGESRLGSRYRTAMLKDTDRQALLTKTRSLRKRLMNAATGFREDLDRGARASFLTCDLLHDEHNLRKALMMITAPDSDAGTKIRCRKIAGQIERRLARETTDALSFLADNGF